MALALVKSPPWAVYRIPARKTVGGATLVGEKARGKGPVNNDDATTSMKCPNIRPPHTPPFPGFRVSQLEIYYAVGMIAHGGNIGFERRSGFGLEETTDGVFLPYGLLSRGWQGNVQPQHLGGLRK